jgi:hypothetical protein
MAQGPESPFKQLKCWLSWAAENLAYRVPGGLTARKRGILRDWCECMDDAEQNIRSSTLTRLRQGCYARDWRRFLRIWSAEMQHLAAHREMS